MRKHINKWLGINVTLIILFVSIPVTLFFTALIGYNLNLSNPIALAMLALLNIITIMWILNGSSKKVILPRYARAAEQIDQIRKFQLGILGHIGFAIMGFVGLYVAYSQLLHHEYVLVAVGLSIGVVAAALLMMHSPISPWFIGPSLLATPEGIYVQKYFVPWNEVVSVATVIPGKGMARVQIKTKQDLATYNKDSHAHQECSNYIIVTPLGALPESMAHYLDIRRQYQLGLESNKNT